MSDTTAIFTLTIDACLHAAAVSRRGRSGQSLPGAGEVQSFPDNLLGHMSPVRRRSNVCPGPQADHLTLNQKQPILAKKAQYFCSAIVANRSKLRRVF
jgi:hypothetical protein